jgi:hypothetical protein
MNRAALAAVAAVAVWTGAAGAPALAAQGTQGSGQQAPARPKFVRPVKGVAEIGYLKPVVKVEGNEVVTTIKIKNLSNGAIAGLRVDEFWYDKAGTMLPGDTQRVRQPILPGEVVTIILRTPKNPKMDRNTYQFSHANGTIKAKILPKLE